MPTPKPAPTPQPTPVPVPAPTLTHYPFAAGLPDWGRLTPTPDGKFWMLDGCEGLYVRSPAGETTFVSGSQFNCGQASNLIYGPDGNFWLADGVWGSTGELATVRRVTPQGAWTAFPIPDSAGDIPTSIALGSDGAIWFSLETRTNVPGKVGRITMAGEITQLTVNSRPSMMIAGPDGALWFTDFDDGRVGRITVGGTLTYYSSPRGPYGNGDIAVGPDGNLWLVGDHFFVRMTLTGSTSTVTVPGPDVLNVWDMVAGPDGNLWFSDSGHDMLGVITPQGDVQEFPLPYPHYDFPSPSPGPRHLTLGQDNHLWFLEGGLYPEELIRIS